MKKEKRRKVKSEVTIQLKQASGGTAGGKFLKRLTNRF
ncbi:hypothetical protein SAMN05216233_110173 [Desulfoluna spongiiphila]|uniref:Uncharacterized protein n=1 Tax=Desulfoluna spongiiphila TaxID=419481 RepID=A0A1G5GI21_9BACT|nr:hypothetical protein SAMN05216233_110173 [Desulfoluna spongiiphila]